MDNNEMIPFWDVTAAEAKGSRGSFARKAVRVDVFKNNNEIFAAGCYRTDGGSIVPLSGPEDPMLAGTVVYSAELPPVDAPVFCDAPVTAVENSDCILVARKMLERGLNPALLNLADCHVACGFYPRGSNAQEESVCRSTTLSRSLYQYYDPERAAQASVAFRGKRYPMDYHFGGIYSPDVVVFRDPADWFRLLEKPFKLGIISVAALNFREKNDHKERDLRYRSEDGGFTPEGLQIMKDKIHTIYRIALANGHDSLVLGAFGCGAFRLRADLVAGLFRDILAEAEFRGRFKEVRFAILERGRASMTGLNGKFAPFYEVFG